MAILNENIEGVVDRPTLANYIRDLVEDFQANPESWGNKDLPDFLMAMAAWVEDMDGYYANKGIKTPEIPSWKTLAEILTASSVYE